MADDPHERAVEITLAATVHAGLLAVPRGAAGLVIFAHGSGSSRLSPRNTLIAQALRGRRLATLLFDLLTEDEDRIYQNRFNIELLADRLLATTVWAQHQSELRGLALGYFGASTGAAAALKAAAALGPGIRAIVSRGGRPDLARSDLARVRAPTLLIVGGKDDVVIGLNRLAYEELQVEKKLEIIPGATHLFEEPGKLEEVARLAGDWLARFLTIQTAQ